jgi:hypothetical protein
MIGIVSSRGNHDREAIMAPCDYGKKRNEIASDRIVDVAHGWIPIFFFLLFSFISSKNNMLLNYWPKGK